jgi:hypothetical protein
LNNVSDAQNVPLGFDIEMIWLFYQVCRHWGCAFGLFLRDLGQVQRVLARLAMGIGSSPLALTVTDAW